MTETAPLHPPLAEDGAAPPAPLSWPAAVALHLTPGVALLLLFVASAPALRGAGLPPVWGLLLGALLTVVPLELGAVLLSARRRGVSSWPAALGVRSVRRQDLRPLVLTGVAAAVLPGLVLWSEPLLRDGLFGWLPGWFTAGTTGLSGYPPAVQVATLALWLVVLVVVGPAVEELYFRGWLLPRLRGGRLVACAANAALFSLYHLWQPQAWLTVFLFALPLAVLVRGRRNPLLSFLVHASINLIAFAGLLAGAVQR